MIHETRDPPHDPAAPATTPARRPTAWRGLLRDMFSTGIDKSPSRMRIAALGFFALYGVVCGKLIYLGFRPDPRLLLNAPNTINDRMTGAGSRSSKPITITKDARSNAKAQAPPACLAPMTPRVIKLMSVITTRKESRRFARILAPLESPGDTTGTVGRWIRPSSGPTAPPYEPIRRPRPKARWSAPEAANAGRRAGNGHAI